MNVNYFKTLWRNTLVIMLFGFGLTSVWGQTYLLQEGFSTTSTPSGWSGDMYINSTANIGNLTGSNGVGFNANNKYLQTPPVNSPGILTFYYKGSAATSQISFKVQKSVNGSAFEDVMSFAKPHNNTATQGIVPINDSSNNVIIKFIAYDRTGNSLYIDDIQLTKYEDLTPSYTLTYTPGANGAIDGTSPQTVNEGEDGTAVTAVPDEGYHFVNWSDAVMTATRQHTNVTEDISVTANFAINTYTVTYDGNGVDVTGTAPIDENSPYNHGSNVTVLGAGDLVNNGFSFAGWNTQTNGSGTAYAENDQINITSDITLYAQWLDDSLEPQTITFEPLANVTYGDAAFNLTATSDSGLAVSYASSNENVATIDGNTVTIVGVGTTDITASQLGDEEYQPATPVVQTLTVNPKNLTIADVIVLDKPYDGTTAAEIDISVAWLVGTVAEDDISFAIEMVTGEFASADVGTDIEVTLHYEFVVFGPAAANYTLTQPTLTGNINKADQTLSGFENITKHENDEDFALPATTAQGFTLAYASSNEAVATVSGNTVTIVGIGLTTITATQEGNNNYNSFETTITLTVTEAPATYNGVGTFVKITTLNDLTDGYYVVVGNGTNAMNTTVSSSKLQATTITVTDNKITDPITTIVWKVETVSGNIKTIFNENANGYVSGGGSNTNITLNTTGDSNSQKWNASVISNLFRFTNLSQSGRALWYNGSVFGQYSTSNTTGYYDLELYKLTPPSTDPLFTVSETELTAFNYVANNGPSTSDSFTLSGANLEGSAITVTAPANFEVSTDNTSFDSSLNLSSTDGTLAEITVYVRLAVGLTADNYSGNITISGGTAPEVTVAVSGEVTCATATYSFADETVSKTAEDDAFTNEFTTNNTSATVFASSNPAVATVHPATGEVSIVGAGTATINVTQEADGTYCAVSASYELNVTTLEPLLVFSGNTDMGSTCFQGEAIEAEYTVTNNGGSTANNVVFLNTNPAFQVFPPVSPQNIAPGGFVTFAVTFNPMMGALPNTNNNTLTAMSNGETLASHNITATVIMPMNGDVATYAATNETETGVTFNGQITDLGTCWNVTEYGFVYATTPNPTNANFSIIAGTNPSFATPFQFTLGGVLTPGTTYYYKAYVKYTQGFADYYHYGNEESFITTLSTPTATAATNVSSNSFTANWDEVAGATSYEVEVYTKNIVNTNEETFNVSASGNQPTAPTGWTYTNIATSSDYLKMVQNSSSNGAPTIISPAVDVTNYTTLRLNAQIATFGSPSESQRTVTIYVSTNNGNNWTQVATRARSANNSAYETMTEVNLDSYVGYSQVKFKIEAVNATTSVGARLKDIILSGQSSLTTSSSITGSPFTTTSTSLNVNGLDSETTYYYTVKSKTDVQISDDPSNEISVTTLATPIVTWTIDNEWSNETGPTITDDVIIEGDNYVVTGNVAAKTLTVANGGKITIPENAALTVEGKITNNGDFIINNEGVLYQNNYTGANEGDIKVERDAKPMRRLDYTLWSSPVSGMMLNQFSNISNNGGIGTIWNRVYELGATAWESVWDSYANATASTETFATAKGYLYRAFNSYDPVETTIFTGEFTGVPNNGDYSINTPNMFDAIGNPYPSPVFSEDFFNANVGAGAIYFWTNVNSSNGVAYTYNNWASYTLAGGVGVQAEGVGEEIEVPNGWIHPGVGFVVYTEESTASVLFNNSMRINTNGALGREMATEKSRFWLNLSNEEVTFNQILVGYMDNATQGVDSGIDGKMFAYEGNALYSIIENNADNYVIQGRSLPFTASDVVALGFRAVNTGSFTISLHNFDGLFADNQNIYLKDNFTQAVHNLKDGAYSFVSEEGVFNTRFEVVYQTAMSVENPVANNSNWVVYSQENGFQVQTQGFELKTVQVFDLLGRTVYTANAQGTTHNIPSLGADSVYIVKVTTTDNVVLSKKVK